MINVVPEVFEHGHNKGNATRLLRNSTIFATQKLGLDQCSQKAPGCIPFVKRAL